MMDISSLSSPPSFALPSCEQVLIDESTAAPLLLISCKVPFQTRIFCAANSIARFLGMTQTTYTNPGDAEEFVPMKKGYRYIDNYCDRLCSLYTEPEMRHLDFERWQASEVYTYKGRGTTVGHEFLIATLHDAENREILLRLERGNQASSTHAHVVKGGNAWGGAQQGSARTESSGRWLSEISIFPSSAFNDDYGLPVDHFRFNDGHHVPLPQLVVLASTINEYAGTRRVIHHNCYWFCQVVSEALKKRFSHKLLSADDGIYRWHNMPLYQNVNIDEVLNLYDKSWNKFVQKIDMIINNPNNRDTRMARQQAEEHRQRADREKKRADEEARRRRDAEHELAEIKALLAQRTDAKCVTI